MKNFEKWKVVESEDISPSKWFTLLKQKVALPNGKIVDDYYVSRLGDVAMILAVTSDKKIAFVRQYKHGFGDVIIELPAGRIKNDQTPETAARMELQEETGFIAGNMTSLGAICPVPSKDSCRVFGFFTDELSHQGAQNLDPNEDIEVLLWTMDELRENILSPEMVGSDTLAMLLKASILYPDIISFH